MNVLKLFIKRFLCSHSDIKKMNQFGPTGRGKIWTTYYCPDCNQYFCSNIGEKLFKVSGPDDFGFKKSL